MTSMENGIIPSFRKIKRTSYFLTVPKLQKEHARVLLHQKLIFLLDETGEPDEGLRTEADSLDLCSVMDTVL